MTVINSLQERKRFIAFLKANASAYGLGIEEYVRKVWYHEQAAKIGEFMAATYVNDIMETWHAAFAQERE